MNKSKFLKKSLAMLLALMLVLAMIPLSASAAELPNIEYLYVEGNQVDLEKTMTVDVREGDTTLTVGTNIDLTQYDVEMYAAIMEEGVPQYKLIENNGTTGTTFSGTGVDALSRWAPEDVMTLEVYPIDGPKDDALLARYTLNLNRTQANVTTNLKDVKAVEGSGVYSIDNTIEEINATRTIKVTAAYGTNANGPKIKVYTADEATVNSKTEDEVSAANDAKFEVVSESKNNTAEFKVGTTYVDSLTSFSVNGVKGEITDESNPQDDHNDTITVTLPKDAVLDEYGERLAAEDINFKVEYAIYAKTGTLNFTGDSKWITSGTEVNFGDLATSDEYSKDITTKVIGDVTQTYTLNVQLEKDTDTSIDRVVIKAGPGVEEVARPNGKEINVEVPSNATDTGTVDIYTPTTVTRVAVAGTNVTTVTIENNLKKWTISGVNLTTPKTITVTAENNSIQEYTLTVTKATEVKEPAIESFSIENPETGKVYSGTPDDKRVIEIKVPYMTLNVADWVVRVTPADGTNVLTYAGYAIPSGQYKVSAVSATTAVDVTNGLSFTVDAVAKGNTTDSKTYTVKVVLEEPGSGKTLETLEFTSQTGTDDETVFRALNDDNTFDAKIDQSKKTITLSPALSLAQTGYYHYVTGFTTAKGGVAFVAINGNTLCYEVPAVTSDEDDTAPVTGFELGSGKTPTANHSIIVVPEAIARKAELGGAVSGGSGYALSNLTADEQKSITEYNFVIDPAPALKEADLKTFKIGDVELKVSGNTISGELPWSYTYASATAPNAKFAEFTMGKYAMMYDDGNQPYYSNGDVNGDGEAEDRDANNNGFVFVRGTKDNEVLVYRADKGSVSTSPIESVTVKAEDRLNTGTDKTSKTYDFELKYADPEINANIDSFKLGKYEGTISGTNINVRVPYNTDLKGMIATFTTSTGATVYYNTKAEANKVESGKTVLNYSSPVKLVVHSEKTKGDVVGADSVTVKTYTVTVTEAEMFSDVSSSKWYYDYVLQASNLGIINGKGDGIFAPEEDVTRGDFAVMLTNMLGVTELPHVVNNPFADVNEDIYYSDAIAYCYEQGYIGGYPDGSYRPEATITRQEAAKIIAEALELTETDSDPFTDDNLIHEWAEDYVYQCKAAGIFGGDAGTGNFRPTDAISRAETAKIMVVAHNNK